MCRRAEGALQLHGSRQGVGSGGPGSLRLFLIVLALLPLVIQSLYPLEVGYYISDRQFKDFLFKMIGLGAIGLLVPVRILRWFWWAILLTHFITKDALFRGDASFYLTNIGLGLILFSVLFMWMDEGKFRLFTKAVTISLFANLSLQFLQVFQLDPIHTFWRLSPAGTQVVSMEQVPSGFLGNVVSLGVYYAICLPLLLVSSGKLFPFLAIPLLIGILLTHSKIALLMVVISFLLCAQAWVKEYGQKWKRLLEITFFSFLVLVPFSLMRASTLENAITHRVTVWSKALFFLTDPFFGDGLSSWSLRRFWYSGDIWIQAHNEYLQVFYELGLVGLLFLLAYATHLILRCGRELPLPAYAASLSVLATAVISLVFFPLHLVQISVLFIVALTYLERTLHVGLS